MHSHNNSSNNHSAPAPTNNSPFEPTLLDFTPTMLRRFVGMQRHHQSNHFEQQHQLHPDQLRHTISNYSYGNKRDGSELLQVLAKDNQRNAFSMAQESDDLSAAFVLAAHRNQPATIQAFLDHGMNVDIRNGDGKTALITACKHGYSHVAQLLLYYRANVDMQTKFGSTALMHACAGGHNDIVQMLLEHNANIALQDWCGVNALMVASLHNRIAIVETLLQHNATVVVDVQGSKGQSALSWATVKGHNEIAQLLLELGASANVVDEDGNTPLHLACRTNNAAAVALLLSLRGACCDFAATNQQQQQAHELTTSAEIKEMLAWYCNSFYVLK